MIRNVLPAVLLGANLLEIIVAHETTGMWNWARTVQFASTRVEKPQKFEELAKIVSEATGHVKVFGTAYSMNDIADTDGVHISLENFKEINVDIG